MTIQWYAFLVALVGISLWLRGSVLGSVIALLFFSLFGGGAAFVVHGASITPASFFLVFLMAHTLLSMFRRTDHVNLALKTNGYLAWYCIYSVAMAYLLPRIFANRVSVPPLNIGRAALQIYAAHPLHYSVQNLTTAIYMIGALVASVCAGAAAADPKSRRALVHWGVIISWIHIFFGVAGSLLTSFGGKTIIALFRNATYAETVQAEAGYSRISGIFPEPSAYAGFAFGWFVFMTELWLRDVSPRITAATAAALGLMIIACTSSSGYFGLAGYAMLLALRWGIAPWSVRVSKAVPVAMIVASLAVIGLGAVAMAPHVADTAGRILAELTVGKAETLSGRARLFWASSALKAFRVTWGLGVGPGSFRSSSLLLAILGSTGVIGLIAFTGHVIKILKPLRRDTYALRGESVDAVAMAATWAAFAILIPAVVSSPTPVPSNFFAVFGGLALGWRFSVLGRARVRLDPPTSAAPAENAPRAA